MDVLTILLWFVILFGAVSLVLMVWAFNSNSLVPLVLAGLAWLVVAGCCIAGSIIQSSQRHDACERLGGQYLGSNSNHSCLKDGRLIDP